MEGIEERIVADRSVCMGSGLCAHIAPEHFEVVDGTVQVIAAQLTPATAEDVRDAVECCPTRALAIHP